MSIPLDRLVRKEVSLGTIRERPVPEDHRGLTIAPMMDVATDDVIFEYLKDGFQDGLAPARAEDAEAELAQKDDLGGAGIGRASVIDWSLKDKYTASDVTRYREGLLLIEAARQASFNLPLNFTGRTVEDFVARLARHDAMRRRKLDNRIEWLIMQAVETGGISYNDGKIKFTVDFGRPAAQQNQAPKSGLLFSDVSADPIGDILDVGDKMFALYGVRPSRAITSQRVMNSFWRSNRFLAAAGMPVLANTTTTNIPLDINYLGLNGYNPTQAAALVEQVTGVKFEVYDGIYRTRPVGSKVTTNNRFLSDNKIFFLPQDGQLGEVDDTDIGFAKTLTAPHPEGNWASGFYEWETTSRDPWLQVRGTGIKAFPVFPYMEYTYSMVVL
jgi:hypothetical protein